MHFLMAIFTSTLLYAASYHGLGAESVPPEVVAKFAPHDLPHDLSRKIQAMFDLRGPGMGMVTSDGKKMVFDWRVTGVSQVWRLDRPDGFPVQLTGGEDRTSFADITPDGKYLIVSRDRGGEENPGLYYQSINGGPLNVIQHKAKVQTEYDFTSDDSRYIYFHSNDIKPNSYAIYRYDMQKKTREKLFAQEGLWVIADHRGDHDFLLAKQVGSMRAEYYLWHLGDANTTPVMGQNEDVEYTVAFAGHEGDYFVLTSKLSEYRRLYLFKGGQFTPVTPELKWDVSQFQIDDQRARIYYATNELGYSRVHALDARHLKPLTLPSLPTADQVYYGHISHNGRFVTLGSDSAQEPRSSNVFDWQSHKLTKWTVPSTPEVDVSKFMRATLEYYTAEDGTKIPMFVTRPKVCQNELCPVIVDFHGGPESQSRPGFSPIHQIFAEAGYIYVEPNVRGSDGYGKSWLNADNGAKRLNVITDIRDCATFIRKNWARDGHEPKIGVFGGSYGGYSAQMAMTKFAGSYDAGVSVVGISNLVTFLNNTAPYRRILRISKYGDPEKDLEALKKLSPINYVDQVKAPVLFIQGLNDPRVPAGEAVQMYNSLSKRKIPTELVIFPDEGHGSAKRENQVKQFGYALQFFDQHLR
jgi:dipeptidyl aminopeptidase/acylaminoacyl peptidase